MLNIRLSATCSYMCQENVKYAVRLRNRGQRTRNGDAGMNRVKCPDGTVFTFSSCSLSSNGTNQSRGQIPLIYYYRLVALSVTPCGLWGCKNRPSHEDRFHSSTTTGSLRCLSPRVGCRVVRIDPVTRTDSTHLLLQARCVVCRPVWAVGL